MRLGKFLCHWLLLTLVCASAAFAAPRFTDNGDQTITDNVSGLMWTRNGNLAGTNMSWDAAFTYVAGLNSANGGAGTLGHNDWRQPSSAELMTLVDATRSAPALPAGHPFIGVQSDEYWSSSVGVSSYAYAYGVNMYSGVVYSGHKYNDGYVWPVRTVQAGGGADTSPPSVTQLSTPSTSATLTVPLTAFSASDNVAVTGYCISETNSSGACIWSATPPTQYSFASATPALKTLYGWAKDGAGNISAARSTTVTIVATATVTLGNLSATYDGTAKAATAVTSPAGKTVAFTYNGSPAAPVNAGSYTVVGTVTDSGYAGSATGTLVIAKAIATVTLGNLSATYDGTAKAATAVTSPVGKTVAFTYNGSPTPPVSAGSYTVVATVNDANYTGSATGMLVIAPGSGTATTVTLGSLSATYDGTAKAATAVTSPAGKTVAFTYNGSPSAPVNAGSYTVVGTVTDSGFTGSATGVLVIAKASATVTLGSLSATYNGTPKAATAVTSPAGKAVTFTYNGSLTPPIAVGSYTVVATVNDANYTGSATGVLVIGSSSSGGSGGGSRFTDNGDQTVTDSVSGLTWAKDANLAGTPMSFDDALIYVAEMNSANGGAGTFGHNDWRQPTSSELMTLIDSSRSDPALSAGHPFVGVKSDEYWSSSVGVSSYAYAYGVNMYSGVIYSGHRYNDGYVWPVR